MLHVFSTFVYALLDNWSTVYFVIPLFALTFHMLPEVLDDRIMVSAPFRDNVRIDRVYNDCSIFVYGKTMCADLIELPINIFGVILCME